MTHTKHKEIMERWNNSELAKRINAIEMFAINHHFPEWNGETIPQFISSALTEQLEELERWVEGRRNEHASELKEGDVVHIKKLYQEEEHRAYSQGAFLCLETTLSHIREQKEEYKKV